MGVNTDYIFSQLEAEGYIVSRQRRVIIEAICERKCIDDVEAFWIGIRAYFPVSWSTVHTTVKLLTQVGLLERSSSRTRNQSYSLNPDYALAHTQIQ